MATLVYQGLQLCLESQLVEPRTLRLKLSSPKPHFIQPLELALFNTKELEEACYYEEKISKKTNFLHDNNNKHISSNLDLGGWSFLQAISPTSQPPKQAMETTKPYVHPSVKRTLSEKSLELCTENLGSETGSTDIIENNIFSLSLSDSSDSKGESIFSPTREQQKAARQTWRATKGSSKSYPPPLTTISGSESLQVRSHREDGRLIVNAIKAPSPHTTFHAERSNGRLRLFFFKDSSDVTTQENEAINEDKKEEEDFQEQEDEEEDDTYFDEDMDGNNLEVGGEMGMEKLQILKRCKEGECEKQNLLNWEPFLVATS